MFVPGFDLVSRGKGRLERTAPDRVAGPTFKPSSGAGIAIFLLAFAAGEAATAVHAFRHESQVVALVPRSSTVLSGPITVPTTIRLQVEQIQLVANIA